jgi:hypothetical protein
VRLRAVTIAASLGSLPFLLPHVVEDFAAGVAQRAGLPTGVGASLLGAGLAVQMAGLVLVGAGRRAGWAITAIAGAVWVAGALVDHAGPVLAGGFREGALSVAWVVGLAVGQGAAAALAWTGWRRRA